jgi:putative transposase
MPRDHWIERWERQAIVAFYASHSTDGYRRVAFMMIDADIVAVSPTTVWRVLSTEGLLTHWNAKPSQKGTGFVQPLAPHEHWHVDVSYINIRATFFYLTSVLDGASRFIVAWDIRTSMTEADVEIVLQKGRERFPEAAPRVISDNGPQFIANDFKEFIRLSGMTHVRTSPYYPQSNGKIERWHKTLKTECIRPGSPLSLEDALRIVGEYIDYYNNTRLNSAIGFVAPRARLENRHKEIFAERDRKLEAARDQRKARRQAARQNAESACESAHLTCTASPATIVSTGETDAGSAGEQPARDIRPRFRRNEQTEAALTRCLPLCADVSEIPLMPQKTHPNDSLNRPRQKSISG